MLSKSKKLKKPFEDNILATAKTIAEKYEIILAFEDNEYYGRGLEMPYVFADGKTPDECVQKTKEALVAAVAHLLERGQSVPSPTKEGKRTEQVNIRLTPEEKTIFSAYAKAYGFKGLADFFRSQVLHIQTR